VTVYRYSHAERYRHANSQVPRRYELSDMAKPNSPSASRAHSKTRLGSQRAFDRVNWSRTPPAYNPPTSTSLISAHRQAIDRGRISSAVPCTAIRDNLTGCFSPTLVQRGVVASCAYGGAGEIACERSAQSALLWMMRSLLERIPQRPTLLVGWNIREFTCCRYRLVFRRRRYYRPLLLADSHVMLHLRQTCSRLGSLISYCKEIRRLLGTLETMSPSH